MPLTEGISARVQTHISLLRNAVRLLRSPGDRSLARLTTLVVASGLCPVALVYVTRGVVDRLVAATNTAGGQSPLVSLALWALSGAALMLLSQALTAAVEWQRTLHEERLKEHITERVHAQSVRLDLAFYESPEFFDRLHRAREEASYRPAELCRAFVDVLQGSVVLVGLVAVLVSFGPWLPAILFLSALPVMYVVSTHALEYQRWRRSATQTERRAWYYDFVLTSADHAAELRGFEAGRRFQAAHRLLRARLREEHLNLLWRGRLTEAGATAGSTFVMGTMVAAMAWRAVQGLISLGQLAAFYSAFAWGLTTMRSLLSNIARIHTNALFIEALFEFLALEPRIASPGKPIGVPSPVQDGIRFRNVTFRYPGSARPALDGFNLHVKAGQTAAIVGPNGAGKSTLVKLMCRLYDPLEGSIEIDGMDIRRFLLGDLRNLISPLFQPSGRYFESVDQNIRMGCASSILTGSDIRRASIAAGASTFIEGLPHGYDTPLGKMFEDGSELSAGEWQRLALTRTLARPSPILLLDEPTSALDPWAEGDWYPRFRTAALDRTVVIITHRLLTAMQADVIHVMEHGRIVESGRHDDLLARGGRYAACASGAREAVFSPLELTAP